MHFTPTYSSWVNQAERLFAEVTRDLLQRSDHGIQVLEKDLSRWVKAWNENPKPSSGPRPLTRSWPHSADYFNESTARDTSLG